MAKGNSIAAPAITREAVQLEWMTWAKVRYIGTDRGLRRAGILVDESALPQRPRGLRINEDRTERISMLSNGELRVTLDLLLAARRDAQLQRLLDAAGAKGGE